MGASLAHSRGSVPKWLEDRCAGRRVDDDVDCYEPGFTMG